MSYQALQAETVSFRGHENFESEAYYARPTRPGKVPGVVVIHHMPGWDEWITEVVRKFAHHGYAAIAPHLFARFGPGSPDDVTARARPQGGASDAEVMGDVAASMAFLRAQPNASGKHRRDRLLLGRPPHLSRRLHPPRDRRGGRLLGRARDRQQSGRYHAEAPGGADRVHREAFLSAARHLRQRRQEPDARRRQPHRGDAQAARQDV